MDFSGDGKEWIVRTCFDIQKGGEAPDGRTSLSHKLCGDSKLAMRAKDGKGSDVTIALGFLSLRGIFLVIAEEFKD